MVVTAMTNPLLQAHAHTHNLHSVRDARAIRCIKGWSLLYTMGHWLMPCSFGGVAFIFTKIVLLRSRQAVKNIDPVVDVITVLHGSDHTPCRCCMGWVGP